MGGGPDGGSSSEEEEGGGDSDGGDEGVGAWRHGELFMGRGGRGLFGLTAGAVVEGEEEEEEPEMGLDAATRR